MAATKFAGLNTDTIQKIQVKYMYNTDKIQLLNM